MKKVKLVKFIDTNSDPYHIDLTIGKVYDVDTDNCYNWPEGSIYTGQVAAIKDDAGEPNELYEGEYEIVE